LPAKAGEGLGVHLPWAGMTGKKYEFRERECKVDWRAVFLKRMQKRVINKITQRAKREVII